MGVLLAVVQSAHGVLPNRDAARLRIVLDRVDEEDAAAPFDLIGAAEQVGSGTDHFDVRRQPRIRGQARGYVKSDSFVAHQGIAEADYQQRFHRLRIT